MFDNLTVEKFWEMKLKVMAKMMKDSELSLKELSFEERLGIIVEKECMARKNLELRDSYTLHLLA